MTPASTIIRIGLSFVLRSSSKQPAKSSSIVQFVSASVTGPPIPESIYQKQRTGEPSKLIPYDDRTVHGNRSRRGLRNGDQIQHFILFDPMVFIHKLLFHKRDNHISAAKRECAEIQRGEKQRS